MLKGVTLALVVEFVIEMLINLATGSVLDEKTTENTKTTHPENLAVKRGVNMYFSFPTKSRNCSPWHPCIFGTLPLTKASMSANSTCLVQGSSAGSRVRGDWLADNETIFGNFSDGLP